LWRRWTKATTQTARRKAIYEALHPEAKRGVAGAAKRWHKDATDTVSVAFAADTSAKTGVSERTVWRYVQVGERLADDVKEAIAQTPRAAGLAPACVAHGVSLA
jgi:ParB family chromosome partitioning protein